MNKRWAAAGALVVLVGALGTGLAMAHGGDAGVVHSCVDKNGKILIVDANATCGAEETALDWNITGPEGPKGDKGDTGPQGPAGVSSGPAAAHQEVIGRLTLKNIGSPIDVLGYSTKVTQSGTFAGGGGAGTGKASFSDLSVTKAVDASTPLLFTTAAKGVHIQDARLELFRPGTQDVSMTYTLRDVLITLVGDSDNGAQGTQSLEELGLNFARIEWDFTPTSGSPTTGCYDIKQNVGC